MIFHLVNQNSGSPRCWCYW